MDSLVYDNINLYLCYVGGLWILPIVLSVMVNPARFYNTIYRKLKGKDMTYWKSKLKNEAFQFTWALLRGLIKRTNHHHIDQNVNDYSGRMLWQARLAYLFGGAEAYIYGDSNAEAFSSYRIMRRFEVVTINCGVGGTKTSHWVAFKKTKTWKKILSLMPLACPIQNIGGNDAIQDDMKNTEKNFKALSTVGQISLTVPVIYYKAFKDITKGLRARLELIDTYIRANSTAVIDVADFTDYDKDGVPDPGRLSDIIHISNSTMRALVKVLNRYL